MATINIHEVASLRPSDPEGKLWDVTLIEAGMSANNRLYEAKVLKEAVPLFEGAWTYLDHPTDEQERERPERSILEKAGKISKVKDTGGNLVGEWAVVSQWLRETMLEASSLGISDWAQLSINAVGTGEEVKEGNKNYFRVDRIEKVNSVDVVTVAAAGGKVNRLLASDRGEDMTIKWEEVTLEGLTENAPRIVGRIRDEGKAEVEVNLKASQDRVAVLEADLAKVEAEKAEITKRAEEAEKLLANSNVQLKALDAARIVSEALSASELSEKAKEYVRSLMTPAMREYAQTDEEGVDEKLKASVAKAVADLTPLLVHESNEPVVRDMGGGPAIIEPTTETNEDVLAAWVKVTGRTRESIKESPYLM